MIYFTRYQFWNQYKSEWETAWTIGSAIGSYGPLQIRDVQYFTVPQTTQASGALKGGG